MLQIAKCIDQSCCKFRTNYLTYFSEIFLLSPVPLKSTVDGSLFQAIFLAKYADKCFDKLCTSLQKVDKKGKSTIQKRTCWKCDKYHSTIKVMNSHKRRCDGYADKSDDEVLQEDEDEDKENEEDHIEVEFTGDDEAYEVIYFYTDMYIMLHTVCKMQVDLVS